MEDSVKFCPIRITIWVQGCRKWVDDTGDYPVGIIYGWHLEDDDVWVNLWYSLPPLAGREKWNIQKAALIPIISMDVILMIFLEKNYRRVRRAACRVA